MIAFFARDGRRLQQLDAAFKNSLQPIDRRESPENTVILGLDLDFPAEQQASPGKTGAKAGQHDQVVAINSFTFSGFRKTDGNRGCGGIGVLIYIDGNLGFGEVHLFDGGFDDTKVRLMGYIKLQVLAGEFVPIEHFL